MFQYILKQRYTTRKHPHINAKSQKSYAPDHTNAPLNSKLLNNLWPHLIIPLLIQLIYQPVFVFGSGPSPAPAVARQLVVAFAAGEDARAGGGDDDENVLREEMGLI